MSSARSLFFLFSLLAVGSAVACTKSVDSESTNTEDNLNACTSTDAKPLPFEEYCQTGSAKTFCTTYATCGFYSSKAACEALYANYDGCGPGTSYDRALVAQGVLKYDAVLARKCVDFYAARLFCEHPKPGVAPECNKVITGTVPSGGTCYADYECVATSFCDHIACPGVCAARKVEGEKYTDPTQCAAGLSPLEGVCVRPRNVGDSCAPVAPSKQDLPCAAGAFCGTDKVCATYAATQRFVGDACDEKSPCSYSQCIAGTCAKYAKLGDACDESGPRTCAADLGCLVKPGDTTGTCGSRAPLAVGEACYYGGNQCASGVPCLSADDKVISDDKTMGTCAAQKNLGAHCTYTNECKPDAWCLWGWTGAPGTSSYVGACSPRGKLDEACTDYEACSSGLFCERIDPDKKETWRCHARKPGGDKCSTSWECSSDRCDNGTCFDPKKGVCADPRDADGGAPVGSADAVANKPCTPKADAGTSTGTGTGANGADAGHAEGSADGGATGTGGEGNGSGSHNGGANPGGDPSTSGDGAGSSGKKPSCGVSAVGERDLSSTPFSVILGLAALVAMRRRR